MFANLISYLLFRYCEVKIICLDFGFWHGDFIQFGVAILFILLGLFIYVKTFRRNC